MCNEISGRALVAGIIGALACMVATSAYADAEPVRGRVAGMYYTLTTRTPQFPFLALWQVNESANRGSGSDATPSTSLLDADELATLPADAFKRTAYLCDGGKTVAYELSFSGLTPGADYLLEFYLNEPWQLNTRAQKVQINGETVKDANGDDLVVDPGVIGGNAIKTIGKIAFTNVTAQANGTISFSFPLAKDQPVLNVATLSGTNLPTAALLELKMSGEGAGTLSWGPRGTRWRTTSRAGRETAPGRPSPRWIRRCGHWPFRLRQTRGRNTGSSPRTVSAR